MTNFVINYVFSPTKDLVSGKQAKWILRKNHSN
jgi:hypothetical protein